VARYVPSLGLPSAVLAALANLTTTSDGLYGVPQDTGSSSPSSGSVWGLLWNTFSGLVDTVIAAVHTVVSVVYNAAVATLHFFENLPQALAKWGETAVARTVINLTAVGSALDTALNDLVAAVVSGIKLILSPITKPLEQMASSYYAALNSSMDPNAVAFGNDLSGNFFLLALGLGTAMEIAIGVATPVDLGPSFLITIVIGLLITVALEEASTTGVVNALSSVDSVGGQIVRDFQGWVNGTSASADVKNATRFNQLASIFSLIAAAAVLPFSIGLLAHDLGFAGDAAVGNPVYPILAFALGLITLVLHFVFVIDHVPISLLILGAILGGLAFYLSLKRLKTKSPGPWKTMAAIDLGVSGAGLGAAIYDILSES
jgi:hypothetical protein